jgi:hypothetical protein
MGAILRLLAIAASLVIALGFALFVLDEMDGASKGQQQALAEQTGVPDPVDVAPAPEEEAARASQNTSIREAIDDANDVLLAPFSDLTNSKNSWVVRGVPTLLGLLVYGLGLGLLANFLPKQESHAGDWRAASY